MKKVSLAVAVFILSCGAARADNTGWYAGINAGASRTGMSGQDVNGALANNGVPGASTTLHTTDKAVGIELGNRFSNNFAVEGGLVSLGQFKYEATSPSGPVNGKYKAHAVSLAAVGLIPFTPSLSFYGKGGVHYNTADLSISTRSGNTESRTGWLAGVGLRYDFEGSLYTRVGWDHYAKVGQNGSTGGGAIDLFQVALGMRF